MRIESIKISNLRQLRDLELRFTNNNCENTDKNDIHIILAENGVGKTNILNAITWCLYNQELHLRDRNNALPIVNNQIVEETRKFGGGQVDVSVNIVLSTENSQRMTIKRVATFNITADAIIPVGEKFSISSFELDGGYEIYEDEEETTQIIHKFLPEEINSYIFFDGEQLEKFFSNDQLNNVKNGITELTQASYLKAAYEKLEHFVRETINPQIRNGGDNEIRKQQNKVDQLNDQINISEESISTIESEITDCENRIEELNNKIHGCENIREKLKDLKEVEERLISLNDDLAKKNDELMSFTREYFILFAFYPSIKKLHDYIEQQKNDGKLPPHIDISFLDKIIENKECLVCGRKHLSDNEIEEVRKLRKTITVASETSNDLSNVLGAMTSYFSKINAFSQLKSNLTNEINRINNNIEKEESHRNRLESYIRSIPDSDDVAKYLDERDRFKRIKQNLLDKKIKEILKKEKNSNDLAIEDKKLHDLSAKNELVKEYIRKRDYCEMCINVLKESMHEILNECRVSIQEETFKIFSNLIWKKDTFSSVEILENYSFKLFDKYGSQALGSCSAAETALLALSFTLALQNVSKHDALLFIDTPLGRVGKENRTNFMNTLLEIAKEKQVILAFTPTEYDANVQSILAKHYNSFHSLNLVDNKTVINSKQQ